MSLKYSDMVTAALQIAKSEAVELNSDYIGSEHLFLGILKDKESLASLILQNLKIDINELIKTTKIYMPISTGLLPLSTSKELPFTPLAKKILERAQFEANNRKREYFGTEHILMAFFSFDTSVKFSLLDTGLTYDKVCEFDAILDGKEYITVISDKIHETVTKVYGEHNEYREYRSNKNLTVRELKEYINRLPEKDLDREVWRENDGISTGVMSIKFENNVLVYLDEEQWMLPKEQRKHKTINTLFFE